MPAQFERRKRGLEAEDPSLTGMAKSESGQPRDLAERVEALGRAYEDLARDIEAGGDRQAGLESAARLADLLRGAAESAAELRARVLLRIQEEQHLTLSELGAMVGVTRARAGQLVQVARRSRAKTAG